MGIIKFLSGGLFKIVKDYFQQIVAGMVLLGILYFIDARYPQFSKPIHDIIAFVHNIMDAPPQPPYGGTLPPKEPERSSPLRPDRMYCPPGESRGIVLCPTLIMRDEHTQLGQRVATLHYGDTLELIEEWHPGERDVAVALFPTYLHVGDTLDIPMEKGERLRVIESEEARYFVQHIQNEDVGWVSKDSVEILLPWMRVRTAGCDSGWVHSDSIEVLDLPL
jgi:hypothetical protein